MIPIEGEDGGLSGFFPRRGYAVVFMDLRGTGLSSGCLNSLGTNDQSDLRDVIEWAASEPWSNGRVGMIGHSYVGSTPLIATILKPKGLVTVVPSAGLPAMYDHQWQLGVPYNAQYLGPIESYQQLALQRELPIKTRLPNDMGMSGEHFGKDLTSTGCGLQDTSLSSGEQLAGVDTSPSWPPAARRTLTLRASADGPLGEAPGVPGAPSFAGDPGGFLSASTGNLTFTTAPFAEDTVLLGLPKLTLSSAVTLQPLTSS